MRALLTTTVAILLCVCAATPAWTGTATLRQRTVDEETITTVLFTAAPGEANVLTVRVGRGVVTFTDTGATPGAGAGCTAAGDTVRCPLPRPPAGSLAYSLLSVRAGDGDDRVVVLRAQDVPEGILTVASLEGGPGDDVLEAVSTRVDETIDDLRGFISFAAGGPGADTLTGGPGYDALSGGADADVLRGAGGEDTLDGDGQGIGQRLLLELGLDVVFAETDIKPRPPAAPAPDVLDGGPGADGVTYEGRRGPVQVDLATPGGEDASTAVENVAGGDGPDVLRGDGGPNTLYGGSGADTLEGRGGDDDLDGEGTDDAFEGDDLLVGGPGADRITGPGRGSRCGPGLDRVHPGSGAPVLDGVALRADCELLVVDDFSGAAIRLARPVRHVAAGLAIDMVAIGEPPRRDGARPVRNTLRVVARRQGAAQADGTSTVPAATTAGRPFVLRAAFTRLARRTRLVGVRRLRLTFAGRTGDVTVDLPLAPRPNAALAASRRASARRR